MLYTLKKLNLGYKLLVGITSVSHFQDKNMNWDKGYHKNLNQKWRDNQVGKELATH